MSYRLAGVILVLIATSAAATGLSPSSSVTTTVQGWEHWFRLEWTAQATPAGEEIAGYIYTTSGIGAVNVQVLAQGLDAAGNVVGQKIEWVPGVVSGFSRTYFRVSGLTPATSYRVTMWAFDLRKR